MKVALALTLLVLSSTAAVATEGKTHQFESIIGIAQIDRQGCIFQPAETNRRIVINRLTTSINFDGEFVFMMPDQYFSIVRDEEGWLPAPITDAQRREYAAAAKQAEEVCWSARDELFPEPASPPD